MCYLHTANRDYEPLVNHILRVPDDPPVGSVTCQHITIYGDDIREGNEMFTVHVLALRINDMLTGNNIVTVTIVNDGDGKCTCKERV